jgi:hypothetical protein
MKKSAVIQYYGSVKTVADALGISTQAVYGWPERVPERSAARLDRMTHGELAYDPQDYQPGS